VSYRGVWSTNRRVTFRDRRRSSSTGSPRGGRAPRPCVSSSEWVGVPETVGDADSWLRAGSESESGQHGDGRPVAARRGRTARRRRLRSRGGGAVPTRSNRLPSSPDSSLIGRRESRGRPCDAPVAVKAVSGYRSPEYGAPREWAAVSPLRQSSVARGSVHQVIPLLAGCGNRCVEETCGIDSAGSPERVIS